LINQKEAKEHMLRRMRSQQVNLLWLSSVFRFWIDRMRTLLCCKEWTSWSARVRWIRVCQYGSFHLQRACVLESATLGFPYWKKINFVRLSVSVGRR
jgi:hypothetical protein